MNKLHKMLVYVSENNDFYRKKIKRYGVFNPGDITNWPTLTREELQNNRFNMFSNGYQNKYYWQQLIHKTSSGSSGIPVNVYWDFIDYYASTKELWKRRLKYYGIHPYDKKITFSLNGERANNKTPFEYQLTSPNVLNIDINPVIAFENKALIDFISKFSPRWFYVRPFILKKIFKYYCDFNQGFPESLKYIESYGELLPLDLQNDVSKFFKLPVANMYGSEEINTIAYECPYHKMHILDSNVFVECYKNGRFTQIGSGEAVVTSVTNKAMPLIRYLQGDIICISSLDHTCKCGSNSNIISSIKGRKLECIEIDDENELNPLVFIEMIAEVNNQLNAIILSYHFVYKKSERKLICYIDVDDKYMHWINNIKKTIEQLFSSIIGKIEIEIIIGGNNQNFDKKNKIFEIYD